jgi:hypothetical protein
MSDALMLHCLLDANWWVFACLAREFAMEIMALFALF